MNLFDFDLSGVTMLDFVNMTPYEFGRNVLLPFLLVFVVLWALLEKLHIFSRKINTIFTLGISIILATTPAFTLISQYITNVSGTSMIVIFAILLIGGTLIWALGRGRDVYYEQVDNIKKIERLRKRRQKYLKKADKESRKGNSGKARAYIKMAEDLKDKIELERSRRR